MAPGLGAVFTDSHDRTFIPTGGIPDRIAGIDLSPLKQRLHGVTVTAMCDIDNPLDGPRGATCVLAP